MKVGIVCEGRLAGEDAQVLEHFARRIVPQATVKAFPQGTKPELFAKAGDVAKSLFDTGHDRVVIVWDILPRWEKPDGEAQDLLDLQPSLVNAGVDTHPCLYKVAIHKELEAWLLADGAALSAVLSRPAHPVTIKDNKNAETEGNAKKKLEKLFELHNMPFGPQPSQGSYQPKLAAVRIAEKVPANFGQLGKLKSFRHFGRALTAPC
ncbi:MAG: hypothetical protein Q7J58_10710 [Hydrogenophaga sp.]|uniref:hypothetical protein n=1 Tax=Hydrogenophaga sp. TaxID=1904254 RepID=UPI00271DA9AB|nr:hypothetical protein [Hydrogenophaga sp.]MDO9569837.1 hypothetical protein [Hydrogenophaga sp.]MDP3376060.1 hypothetical protein [Hydrogenophaga sp.]